MLPCESSKIQQVMLNILRNGAQAMQEANTASPMFIIRIYAETVSQMICIEIEDNGPGMDEETRLKVFDPFLQQNLLELEPAWVCPCPILSSLKTIKGLWMLYPNRVKEQILLFSFRF